MRMRVLLFEIQDVVVDSRELCFFKKTLVDIWGIDFCRSALKSPQNVIHSLVKIDSAPSISLFQQFQLRRAKSEANDL